MSHLSTVGHLAQTYLGERLPLQVLHSPAGYYIGTSDHDGPASRESVEYFPTLTAARHALDTGAWTQRSTP
jgi:hypothetical protein